MTLGGTICWILFAIVLVVCGNYGGVLLLLSRAIDNMRAAIRCAELATIAAMWEWKRQWSECKRWARSSR